MYFAVSENDFAASENDFAVMKLILPPVTVVGHRTVHFVNKTIFEGFFYLHLSESRSSSISHSSQSTNQLNMHS